MNVALIRPLGRMLRPMRAGMDKTAWFHPAVGSVPDVIALRSKTFGDGQLIPQRCAGAGVGDNVSPQLSWSGVPGGAVELILVVEDPDVPLPRPVVHCVVTRIDPRLNEISEGALNAPAQDLSLRLGRGSFGRYGYTGPRPVPGHGSHRYIFQVFALNAPSGLHDNVTRADTLAAIEGQVIARGCLTGTYQRD